MCPRRLLPFSVTRGLEYSTETVAGPICWVTVARWLSPLGGRDSPSARATLENNPHVQRKVLFMATGITPYAYHRINARIPKSDGRSAEDVYGLWVGLNDISAQSSGSIWATGFQASGAVVSHWDGGRWTNAPVLPLGGFRRIAFTSAGNAWAVGSFRAGNERTLTVFYFCR